MRTEAEIALALSILRGHQKVGGFQSNRCGYITGFAFNDRDSVINVLEWVLTGTKNGGQ